MKLMLTVIIISLLTACSSTHYNYAKPDYNYVPGTINQR